MNIFQLLERAALTFPNQTAISKGHQVWCNYEELVMRARRLASGLVNQLKLKPGERVAIVLPNCPEYIEILYAVWYAGLIVVPINSKLHSKEVAFIVENSDEEEQDYDYD